MIRRLLLGFLLALLAVGALIGAEVFAAVHREYDPTEPAMRIGGTFGSGSGAPLRFVVLGDSTAAGVGAGDPAHTYPVLVAERLAADGGRSVTLIDLGVSGARVHDVLVDQVPKAEAANPDVVFVGIGANDVTHLTSLSGVRADMEAIVARLEATGAMVVVAGPPDMRAAAFPEPLRTLSGWRGNQVRAQIEAAARQSGVAVVPLAVRTGNLFAEDPDRYYSPDRFHPGPQGYRAWADAITPVVERVALHA